MIRIYFAALVGAVIFLSYFVGLHVANIKCNAHVANINSEQIILQNKIMEKTNEVVFHTGAGDVRRILREKYTIVE